MLPALGILGAVKDAKAIMTLFIYVWALEFYEKMKGLSAKITLVTHA